jgi:hypothetical protein
MKFKKKRYTIYSPPLKKQYLLPSSVDLFSFFGNGEEKEIESFRHTNDFVSLDEKIGR